MPAYVDIYDMQENANFRKQVIVASRIAADQILNEDPETANHANRIAWAQQVLGYNGVTHADIVQSMIVAVTSNPTLQQAAPNGPWPDGDIQFVVNSLVDIQASAGSSTQLGV